MLGYESERRNRNLLVAVGEGERDLEAARTRLCAIPDFALHAAFERVDRDCSASVSSIELVAFLRDNGVHHVSEGEAYELVKFFDSDGNCRLTYDEFIQILLPCEDMVLRNITIDRPSRRVARFEMLPRDIEVCMTAILEKEIDLQRRLETLKRDLQVAFDYSHMSAFRSVDRYNSGKITTVNLGAFLRSLGHYASEMELLAIIRRLDTDGDCEVDFTEFAEFMTPISPLVRPALPLPPHPVDLPLPPYLPHPADLLPPPLPRLAPPIYDPYLRRERSPIRHATVLEMESAALLERARSVGRTTRPRVVQVSPTRTAVIEEVVDYPLYPSPRRFYDPLPLPPRRVSPVRLGPAYPPHPVPLPYPGKPILRPFEEDELVHGLKEQCNLENELEAAKIQLAHKPDFNLSDAFAIFDVNRDGFITAHELHAGLAAIGAPCTLDECDIFIARYDNNGDHRLQAAELNEAFLAHDPYYNSMVSRRSSNYVPRPIRPDDCFLPNT